MKIILLEDAVEIKWHGSTKKHYVDLGYQFTKMGDSFIVKVEDLPKGSHTKVKVKCDVCGKEYTKAYREYLEGLRYDDRLGDLCGRCAIKRIHKITIEKYGGLGLQSPVLKENIKKTNQQRYGCDYPMQNSEVYKKVRQAQTERYGGIGMASEVTRRKIEETNMELRGVKNPSQSEEIKQKKQQTMMEHYGVPHIFQDPERFAEILQKARTKMYQNKSIPSSSIEKSMVKMLQNIYGEECCYPEYLVSPLTFDCLLVVHDTLIDVEYDGWYWHKNTQERDKKRNYKVLNLGYKILRIKSKTSLPTEEQVIQAVDDLVNGKHLVEITLDT